MVVILNDKIFFIFFPININTNIVLVFNLLISFMSMGTGFQTYISHVHVLDILELCADYFCTVLDVTMLRWTIENISHHYFEY